MKTSSERLHELFEEMVPMSGPADSVAGELVRAMSRIEYRNYNDGDHLGIGYGNETCNPAGRYLKVHGDKVISALVDALWGICEDEAYDGILNLLIDHVVKFVDAQPELRDLPTEDMWTHRMQEDYQYEDEEEDWDDEE